MSKSRSGKTPSSNQNAAPVTTQNAIIPGKFMESDWLELIEIEDGENFITDLIDEITDSALDQVYDRIIQSRGLPYTVLAARELLLDVIEWPFLLSDCGEVDTNEKVSWIEDSEPSVSVIDNWAQGAVPLEKYGDSPTSSELADSIDEVDKESSRTGRTPEFICADLSLEDLKIDYDVPGDIIQSVYVSKDGEKTFIVDKSDEPVDRSETVSRGVDSVPSSPVMEKSKKYRPHTGSLPTFEKISLESVTDLRPKPGTRVSQKSALSDFKISSELLVQNRDMSSELLVRTQYGRNSGPKEVFYNEKGKVVKVEKLNVENFPSHRVPVNYSILDAETATDKMLNFSARAQQSKKKRSEKNNLKRNRINAKTLLQRMQPSVTSNGSQASDNNGSVTGCMLMEPRSPLPPLMVDSMNVTDGVTVREGGLSKQVVKSSTQETSATKRSIHPICSSAHRVLGVKDIVPETSPSFEYITAPEA